MIIRSSGDPSRAGLLRRAVRSAISQTNVRIECVVVFNGSRYDAQAIAWTKSQPHVRAVVLDGPDKARATLLGRSLVRSEFFCYLDDDDELLPGALARRVHTMRVHPWLDCVATNGFYVQGAQERLLYSNGSPVTDHDYLGSLLESRNWLASCGGLFRTKSVRESLFDDLPPHREWTVIAFRIAASLSVRFEDVPTFRIHDTGGSQSKTQTYVQASAGILEQMIAVSNDPAQTRRLRKMIGRAHRAICSHHRVNGNLSAAWPAYWAAVRSAGGWKHLPYGLLLLTGTSLPMDKPVEAGVRLFRRLVRNPRKYADREWWLPILRVQSMRARAAAMYTLGFMLRSLVRRPRSIYVFPSRMDRFQPAETYVAWKVFAACGLAVQTRDPSKACIAIAWNPSTTYALDERQCSSLAQRMRVLNSRCTDIRKSTVGSHFREVFGYALEVDPRTYEGPMVCKSENNGKHDGNVVKGPLKNPLPGYLYQRFVSNPTPLGNAEYRVFIVGQKAVAVYLAHAPMDNRFGFGKHPEMTTLEQCFSAQERERINAFCARIGLDFGGLDILRDADDGRIYISDCNNTVTGPSNKLTIRQQFGVINTIAREFEAAYLREPAAASSSCAVMETGI
ncbi:MAG TPA: glycosyltransferase [Candidatus Baltobacteraceae bacterium]|nr:glycosyltransferase [Candidatus Baltobacteraceae bacterium]